MFCMFGFKHVFSLAKQYLLFYFMCSYNLEIEHQLSKTCGIYIIIFPIACQILHVHTTTSHPSIQITLHKLTCTCTFG